MKTRDIDSKIFGIALPAVVANITIPLLGLLDVGIAGHLGNATLIGAIAVGTMVFNLIYWNFGFLRMGTSGVTAQAYGSGDRRRQALVLQHVVLLGVGIGVAVTALQWPLKTAALWLIGGTPEVNELAGRYVDVCVWGAPAILAMMGIKGWFLGMQDSRSPMQISIGVNVLNVAFSLVAVYGLGLGFVGIAAGTVVAEYAGLVLSLVLLWRRQRWVLGWLDWRKAVAMRGDRQLSGGNRDIFVRSFMMMLINLIFLSVGARSGDVVLAVNTLIMQMFTLYSYFMDGIAFAGEALVGKAVGQRDEAGLGLCVRRLMWWGGVVMTLFAMAYAAFPRGIFSLLTTDGTVVDAALAHRWWCLCIPLAGMAAFVWDGVFIGMTRTGGMLLSAALAFVVFVAVCLFAPAQMGNDGLWLAFVLHLAVRGAVQTVLYVKWRHRHYELWL